MREQQRKLESYLGEQMAACRRRSELLAGDGRVDEGNFEKIRANVYEIFKTVLSAAERVSGEDDLAKRQFFLEKMEEIPDNWRVSYEKARQQGDVDKMHVESIKLDTIREIKDMCTQIWEETA